MGPTEPAGPDASRGQAHALEGIAAALLILTSVVFALQVTAVTPLTASTASQHLQTQGAGVTEGALATAAERGALKDQVLYWNESTGQFYATGESGTYGTTPPTEFGTILDRTLAEAGLIYNVNVLYLTSVGDQRVRPVVHQGEPSDQAVTVTRTITLYDDDRLRAADESPSGTTLAATDGFFINDVAQGPLYNVVRVEVVVWQV